VWEYRIFGIAGHPKSCPIGDYCRDLPGYRFLLIPPPKICGRPCQDEAFKRDFLVFGEDLNLRRLSSEGIPETSRISASGEDEIFELWMGSTGIARTRLHTRHRLLGG
jgi:hypothetical protein